MLDVVLYIEANGLANGLDNKLLAHHDRDTCCDGKTEGAGDISLRYLYVLENLDQGGDIVPSAPLQIYGSTSLLPAASDDV